MNPGPGPALQTVTGEQVWAIIRQMQRRGGELREAFPAAPALPRLGGEGRGGAVGPPPPPFHLGRGAPEFPRVPLVVGNVGNAVGHALDGRAGFAHLADERPLTDVGPLSAEGGLPPRIAQSRGLDGDDALAGEEINGSDFRRRRKGAPWLPQHGSRSENVSDGTYLFRQVSVMVDDEDDARICNIQKDGHTLTYAPEQDARTGMAGLYIAPHPLGDLRSYFEVEIKGKSPQMSCMITVGLCSRNYPLDIQPGWTSESIAMCLGDGLLYRGRPRGTLYGPRCYPGDRVGCGIRRSNQGPNHFVQVYFTVNGKESAPAVGFQLPPGGLHPVVGLQNTGEQVQLHLFTGYSPEEDIMLVDGGDEEDWVRMHDIRITPGQMLEYVGRGKSLVDVGIAQAKTAISTRNHYFEIEIVDPGSHCYIAIGLAHKDYPKSRHPGWNKGSIAYHADDGKIFAGSGVGAPFGPKCYKGDVMGCGILFPKNYVCKSDSDEELEQQSGCKLDERPEDYANYYSIAGLVCDSGDDEEEEEDDERLNDQGLIQSGVQVEIYFTRNGTLVGRKTLRIPKGGFFPTIGMMSSNEKVRVDLKPLTG
ncbi:hypothetical protein TCAL_10975, partial [Tigriopus californicus]|eukprot:TCALIF_10975-PA protein Name:"Similar to SPRYD3 SPRY domain-containing protein 3 (Homo sapiens)" AED:0.13 eAED:0.14 QI:7/0/0/1/0.5/0.33/3/0/588